MHRWSWFVFAAALLGAVAAGAWWLAARAEPARSMGPASRAVPRPGPSRPRSASVALTRAAQATRSIPAAPSQPERASPSAPDTQAVLDPEQVAGEFQAQARDAALAEPLERELSAAFSGFPRTMLEHVECRASICAISAVHGDSAAYEAWASGFPAVVARFSGMTIARTDRDDGSVQTRSFVFDRSLDPAP